MPTTYTYERTQRMTVVAETSEQAERLMLAHPAWITSSRHPRIVAVEKQPDDAATADGMTRHRFGDVEVDIPARLIEEAS